MKALRKIETVAATMPVVITFAGYPVAANETVVPAAARTRAGTAKNIALFMAAPFVGLAYVLAFPVVGLAMLAWMGIRALVRRWKPIVLVVRNIALFLAAPFIGLAYAVALPFVALGMLVWKGAGAMVGR